MNYSIDSVVESTMVGSGSFGVVKTFDPYYENIITKLDGYDSDEKMVVKRCYDTHLSGGCVAVRELDLLIKLSHPNIVPLRGYYFLTQEYTDDEINEDSVNLVFPHAETTLSLYIIKTLSVNDVRSIFLDILLGIEFIHLSGYVHCDIKPQNTLIFKDNASNSFTAKICDLGSARSVSGDCMAPCVTTESYAAPEQYICSEYTQTIDMWSFGCLVYYVLTGDDFVDCGTSFLWPDSLLDRILSSLPICPSIDLVEGVYYGNGDELSCNAYDIHDTHYSNCGSWRDKLKNVNKKYKKYKGKYYRNCLDFSTAVAGSESDLEQLLSGLLCFDPDQRFSATEVINLPMFNSYRNRIEKCRLSHPPLNNIYISKCSWKHIPSGSDNIIKQKYTEKLTNFFAKNVENIYKTEDCYMAASHFTGIQIMANVFGSAEDFSPDSEQDIWFLLMICMIIGSKYHSTYDIKPLSYDLLMSSPSITRELKAKHLMMEQEIVKSQAGNLCNKTIYDMYEKTKNIKILTNLFQQYIS